jgi:cardiolipin synthase
VTRRAPPLDIDSRNAFTRRSVHRPLGRWTAFWSLLIAASLTGCHVLPQVDLVRSIPLSRSKQPVDVVSPEGMVGRAARARLTRKLATTGDTALLDYHLAAMQEIGAPPLLTGNRVELLVDGPRTYAAMFAAIEGAREYLLVESFIFEVLYDAVGSLTTDEKFLGGLEQAGVAVCAFNPLNPLDPRFAGLNQRDHRKIVVVDGDVAFAGGVNFSKTYRIASSQARHRGLSQQNSIEEGWRDTHLVIHGTAARHLEALFRTTWDDARCKGTVLPPYREQTSAAGNMLVQVVPSSPQDETNLLYATMLSVITYAQQSIDITMAYFVPDDVLEKALMDAARRGVHVRIILPSYSDFSGVFYAGRAHYRELLDAGVQLYELRSAFLHSKSIVVDGVWSSVGSTNFDWRSFVHNHEISVCVIDEGFARSMGTMFVADLAESREITLAAWKKRGFKERMKELMWLPIQYWL